MAALRIDLRGGIELRSELVREIIDNSSGVGFFTSERIARADSLLIRQEVVFGTDHPTLLYSLG